MKFRNVKVPEGINVSPHRPVKDLFVMVSGAVLLFTALGLIALLVGSFAGRYLPMSWENAMADALFEGAPAAPVEVQAQDAETALQQIADRLAGNMNLPDGLQVTVHYLEQGQINAFATLGGHIFVYRGLIARMPNENALAMVLAHEIAHAANRDIARNMGGVLLAQLVLGTLVGMSPETVEGLIWGPNALLLRRFSRAAEFRADRDGLVAVAATYGHVAGADSFFRILLAELGETVPGEGPEFLSTHPLTAARIVDLEALARENGWTIEGTTTPLPQPLAAVRETD